MQGDYLVYGLLTALAIALLFAAFTDMRRRQIDNWLNAGIALAAPVYWYASGLTLWPGVALQFAVAAGAFAILAVLFALKMMGGGDVKLLTALALWLPWQPFLQLVVLMSLLGGVLTIVLGSWHVMRRQKDKLKIPYGVAIATAGIWVLAVNYWPVSQAAGGHLG
ncbi:prepilin peptidase [Novosphingobium sp. ZN18A2]|uniref:A24 family peptidase n=1 Tax=Novosphingobium sp. ZN18A2 TaxID=3079861 RepID=UPI0030D35545